MNIDVTKLPMSPLTDPIERERCPRCGAPGRLLQRVPGRTYWWCDNPPCMRRKAAEARRQAAGRSAPAPDDDGGSA